MIDIVVDLETLGTRPGCAITEIGACAVSPETGRIQMNFSRRVEVPYRTPAFVRAVAEGGVPAPADMVATCRWWTDAEHPKRAETLRRILGGGVGLDVALRDLSDWIGAARSLGGGFARVWANGPSFDIAILAEAYAGLGIPRPWKYWDERCVRTALEQAGYERGSVPWIERGPRHRALNDARHEARKLYYSGALGEASAIIRRLRWRGTVGEGRANA